MNIDFRISVFNNFVEATVLAKLWGRVWSGKCVGKWGFCNKRKWRTVKMSEELKKKKEKA